MGLGVSFGQQSRFSSIAPIEQGDLEGELGPIHKPDAKPKPKTSNLDLRKSKLGIGDLIKSVQDGSLPLLTSLDLNSSGNTVELSCFSLKLWTNSSTNGRGVARRSG